MILLLVTGPAALDAEGPYEAEEPSGPRKPLALRGGRKVVVCLQYAGEGYVQLPPGEANPQTVVAGEPRN